MVLCWVGGGNPVRRRAHLHCVVVKEGRPHLHCQPVLVCRGGGRVEQEGKEGERSA